MVNMYEIVDALCKRKFISVAQMCRNIGIRPTVISELKHGRTKSLSHANMVRIANYFEVSIDVFAEGVFAETLPNDVDTSTTVGYPHLRDNKKKPATNEGDGLSEEGMKFAEKISRLSPEAKQKLREYMELLELKDQQ